MRLGGAALGGTFGFLGGQGGGLDIAGQRAEQDQGLAEVVDRGEQTVDVVIPVSGDAWLAQLLVRLGPEASVVEPASLRDVGRALAAELLALYD